MDLFSVKTIKELFRSPGRFLTSLEDSGRAEPGAIFNGSTGAPPRLLTRLKQLTLAPPKPSSWLWPQKRLGQNFLTSKEVLGDILKAAQLTRSDTVLEIGPGIGTLTRALAQSAKKVIAVEKDPAMVEILKETTKDLSNITIISGDILKLNLTELSYPHLNRVKNYKVVANLPYYITSPVIRLFLEAPQAIPNALRLRRIAESPARTKQFTPAPKLLILMVQKEVAQRICSKPPNMSLLAIAVQFYATPSIVSYVKKSCFWPQPKVDSAILKIIPQNLTELSFTSKLNRAKFFKIVKAGFKQPRKQLGNNLIQYLPTMLDTQCLTSMRGTTKEGIEQWLKKNNIGPTQRAETLSVEDWVALTKSFPKT